MVLLGLSVCGVVGAVCVVLLVLLGLSVCGVWGPRAGEGSQGGLERDSAKWLAKRAYLR